MGIRTGKSPRVKPELFTEKGLWQFNACGWKSEFYPMLRGYLVAGQILAKYIFEKHREQDGLLYPIVFLYRQHIELSLKELVEKDQRLRDLFSYANSQPTDKILRNHSLKDLWNYCQPLFKWMDAPRDERKEARTIVYQFEKIDPNSISFRYPKDLEGKKLLEFERINIKSFVDAAEKLVSFLECSHSVAAARVDSGTNNMGEP